MWLYKGKKAIRFALAIPLATVVVAAGMIGAVVIWWIAAR